MTDRSHTWGTREGTYCGDVMSSTKRKVSTAGVSTPIGVVTVAATETAVVSVEFEGRGDTPPGNDTPTGVLADAVRQLEEYFAGLRTEFDLPIEVDGTDFQRAAWSALKQVPHGETISYGEQARRMGRPTAVRAVGAANGRNPVPVIVPCHRVIGANGSLTGFAGGIEIKTWLLGHEKRVAAARGAA